MSRNTHSTRNRAGCYYRSSSDKQEASVERQQSQVRPYAESQGYEIVAEEEDDGIRGHVFEGRAGFQRILELARSGRIDVIVVDELSRLSRAEVVEFIATVVHPLRQAGVTVDSVAEGPMAWEDVVSLVMLVVRQDRSSGESKTISRRVLTRLLMIARSGAYVPPIIPYGYRAEGTKENRRLVVGPEDEVKVVRWLFDAVANKGWSVHRVCKELSERGVKPPSGNGRGKAFKERNLWHEGSVRKMLRNRRYVGDCTWGETSQAKHCEFTGGQIGPPEKGQSVRRRQGADVIVVADTHPALIDRDTFQRAQEALSRRQKDTSPKPAWESKHLLTRLLVCHDCGRFMVGNNRKGRRFYRCSTYQRRTKAACFHNAMYEDVLVDAIVSALRREYLNPDALAELRQELLAEAERQRTDGREAQMLARVGELDRLIAQGNTNLALLPSDRLAGVVGLVRSWEAERDRLRGELDGLERVTEDVEEEVRQAEARLWDLREAITSADPDLLRAVLQEIVGKVELHFTHKVQGKKTTREFTLGVIYVRGFEDESHLGTSPPKSGATSKAGSCQNAPPTRPPSSDLADATGARFPAASGPPGP